MTTQKEWTEKAQRQGDKVVLLEISNKYVTDLRQEQTDWRNYYQKVSESVFQQQSHSS